MSKQLTERETAMLKILGAEHERPASTPTGDFLARTMVNAGLDTSPAGAHRTAASLVRKNLAWRAGTPVLQWYRITQSGLDVLTRKHRSYAMRSTP